MCTPLRNEVEKVRKDFGLMEKLKPVGLNEWRPIENKVYDTFCILTSHKSRPTWIWEALKVENWGIRTERKPSILLDRLIDHDKGLFLLLNERHKFWVYEGTLRPIQTIIQECVEIDEVVIVNKKFDWILFINHHDDIIAGGPQMVVKLKALQNELAAE